MAKKKRVTRTSRRSLPGVKVVADETTADVLAGSIVSVAKSARELLDGKLNRRAILVLIKNSSGVPICSIEKVLDAAASLAKNFTK